MADTTTDRVLAIAPHLSELDNSTVQILIDDAVENLEGTALADDERAQRYLAAHYGSIIIRRTSREEISGEIKVQYEEFSNGSGLKSTAYGQEFLEMSKSKNGLEFRLFS